MVKLIEKAKKTVETVLNALRSLIDSCYYIFTLKFKYSDDFNLFEIMLADSVDYPAYGLYTVHRAAIVFLYTRVNRKCRHRQFVQTN